MAEKNWKNDRFMRNIQPKLNLNSHTQKQSLNIIKTKKTNRTITHDKIDPWPNGITSASVGFSIGIKKQLETMEDNEESKKDNVW